MSYPGVSGYGGYSNSSNALDAQHGYGSSAGRQQALSDSSNPDTPTVQNDARPVQQYTAQEYNWPGQNQHNFGGNNEQGYGTEAWRAGKRPPAAYDYQREYSGQSTSYNAVPGPPMSNAQIYQSSSPTTSKPASTQGLSNLTYASGLESASIKNGASSPLANSIAPSSSSNYATTQSINTRIQQGRVRSPAQTTSKQYLNPARPSFSSLNEPVIAPQQHLALSATQALAGALSRRQQIQQRSEPPAMGNTTSQLTQDFNREASAYSAGQQTSHHRQSSAPIEKAYASDASFSKPSQNPTQSRMSDLSQPALDHTRPPKAPAQINGNIANLVSNDDYQSQPNSTFPAPTEQGEMPSYIDPSKVFNPYHREHERRKREAADSEAAVKRKAAEEAARPKATPPVAVRGALANNSSNSPAAELARPAASVNANDSSQTTRSTAPDVDVDMAAEMKAMMDKMRELKNRDPTMFIKLWDDMRKGGAPASSGTLVASPQLPQAPLSTSQPQMTPSSTSVTKPEQSPKGDATANSYHVIVENNLEGLPDVGRFPAERRIRGSYRGRQAPEARPTYSPQNPMPPPVPNSNGAGSVSAPSRARGPLLPAGVQASKTTTGDTVWPEAKRSILAEAAVKVLLANPQNDGIDITTADIHSMLERNPSYLDLCQMLEAKGLKFHRGQFARSLLRNVPDLAGTHSKSNAQAYSPAATATTSTAPQHHSAPPAHAVQNRANPPQRWYPALPMQSTPRGAQTPSFAPSQMQAVPPVMNVQPGFVGYQQVPPAHIPAPAPRISKPRFGVPTASISNPKPGSKEAMARKRNFSEIVDLTQLSDSEDYVMPQKQPRIASPSPEPDPIAVYEKRSQSYPTPKQGPSQAFGALQNAGISLLPSHISPMNYNPGQNPHVVPSLPPQQTAQKTKMILARAVNRHEALRKSYYDPKTVARDILIAAGRHPSERPLNAHMAGLLGVHIELDSDLSTFDWDAVDPGGPKAPKVEYVYIPAGPPRWKLGERTVGRGREVIQRKKRERDARNLNPNAKPDDNAKAALPAPALLSLLSEQTRQLLHDSTNPSKGHKQVPSRLRESHAVDDDETPRETSVKPQKRKSGSQISVDLSPQAHSQHRSTRSVSVPGSATRMDVPISTSGKRRGRPVGSKKTNPSVDVTKKHIGGPIVTIPPRNPSPPKFPVYRCRWKGCEAQLHNIATIRQHVLKVHRAKTELDPHICWWQKCQFLQDDGHGSYEATKSFDSQSTWLEHIDDAHLHPLGRKYGDGPSTSHTGKPDFNVSKFLYAPSSGPIARTVSYLDPQSIVLDRAKYLSDEQDRTITPTASTVVSDEHPADVLTLTSVTADNYMHVKGYEVAQGNTKYSDKKDTIDIRKASEDHLRAMEARKAQIGPGIDRGGCTLVNDARRATLVQNANIARVVDADY